MKIKASYELTNWHRVFAWLPKRIRYTWADHWIWLESYERRWVHSPCAQNYGYWEFQAIPSFDFKKVEARRPKAEAAE